MSDSAASRILAIVERIPDAAASLAAVWGLGVEDMLASLRADVPIDSEQLFDASDVLGVPSAFLAGVPGASRGFAVALRVGAMAELAAPTAALERAGTLLEHLQLLDLWQGRTENPLAGMDVAATGFAKADGARTAARVRRVLGIGDAPLVDIAATVERLGVPVAVAELPEGLCGLTARDEHDGVVDRVVLVNAHELWTRQRFTVAHELGHCVFDDTGQVIVDDLLESDRLEEIRASAFARHLLLPPDALRELFAEAQQNRIAAPALVARVMAEFLVSREVVVRALTDDGLVGGDHPGLQHVAGVPVGELLAAAGLSERWQELAAAGGVPPFSRMLSARARAACEAGWVHPRVVAEVEGRHLDDVPPEASA